MFALFCTMFKGQAPFKGLSFLFKFDCRSRAKQIDRKMEEELNSVRKDDSLIDGAEMKSNKEDAEDEEDKEEDEDVTFDETDGKLETIESTSQWVGNI